MNTYGTNMEITTFKHERVKYDGTFEDRPGAVETDGEGPYRWSLRFNRKFYPANA